MKQDADNLLLLLVGGVLIKMVVDGTSLRYVRPGFAPVLLTAGLVIVVLAIVAIVRHLRTPDDDAGAPPEDEHASHGAHAPRIAWLLAVPALTILVIAPPALGSDAVEAGTPRPAPVVADALATAALPPGDAPRLTVTDLVARMAADPTGPATTHDVSLEGFLVPARSPRTGTDLARLVISCCAADASPVRVHLAATELLAPTPGDRDQWVLVRGRVVHGTGTRDDGYVPTLAVTAIEPVAAPDPVYEY